MSCNIQQKRCRPASSVEILSSRLQHYTTRNKIEVPIQEILWMKTWAQVASMKLGKTFVETISLARLLSAAKIEAYAERTTKQRKDKK